MAETARTLLFASTNKHKAAELGSLLAAANVRLVPAPVGFDVVEDAPTLAGNAVKKAQALRAQLPALGLPDSWVLADDSGLMVDALGGAPGVRSARFGADQAKRLGQAPHPDRDEGCRLALLAALGDRPVAQRGAQLACSLALLGDDPAAALLFEGILRGHIAAQLRGNGGFGYDPLFVPSGDERTLAELTAAQKDAISHRGQAAKALVAAFRAGAQR